AAGRGPGLAAQKGPGQMGLHVLHGFFQTGRLEGHVVDAFAAPLEKPGHAAVLVQRLQQFDEAAAPVEKGHPHALRGHVFLPQEGEAQDGFEKRARPLDAVHGDGHVADAGRALPLPALRPFPMLLPAPAHAVLTSRCSPKSSRSTEQISPVLAYVSTASIRYGIKSSSPCAATRKLSSASFTALASRPRRAACSRSICACSWASSTRSSSGRGSSSSTHRLTPTTTFSPDSICC